MKISHRIETAKMILFLNPESHFAAFARNRIIEKGVSPENAHLGTEMSFAWKMALAFMVLTFPVKVMATLKNYCLKFHTGKSES